jgi:hypothetical protein
MFILYKYLYGPFGSAVIYKYDAKCEWLRFPASLMTVNIVSENFVLKKEKENRKKKSNDEGERGGFGREVHLQSVLRPILPITLYLEPPRVVSDKAFLFRHNLQTFHVSAAIGKQNCLAIAKHLFTISKPLIEC